MGAIQMAYTIRFIQKRFQQFTQAADNLIPRFPSLTFVYGSQVVRRKQNEPYWFFFFGRLLNRLGSKGAQKGNVVRQTGQSFRPCESGSPSVLLLQSLDLLLLRVTLRLQVLDALLQTCRIVSRIHRTRLKIELTLLA